MRWEQGHRAIDLLLAKGHLERVAPNRQHADRLLAQARNHVEAAKAIAGQDAVGAFQLLYDGARKSMCAILENQGLRATSRGGHVVVGEAVIAQLDPPLGDVFRPFSRMRRRRNEAEYPRADAPEIQESDVLADITKVLAITDAAAEVLDEMGPY